MLTIQPNFTTKQYTQKSQSPLHFKGEDEITEEYIKSKQDFYEEQGKKAEKIINDDRSPEALKKGMRLVKIFADGIWEGLAVLWGARVGSNFVKGSTIKGINSKAAKNIGKGFKAVGGYIAKGFEKLSQSGLAKKAGELVEKLDNTKFGKYIVSAGKAIINAVKSAGRFVRGKIDKIKGTNVEAAYDKVTKGASTALGVGSGAAASYSTAMKTSPAKTDVVEDNEDISDKNLEDEIDELDEDLEDEIGGDE